MNMGPFVKTSIGLAVALSVCVPRVTTAAGPTAVTAAEEQADVVYVQARDLIEQGRFDAAIDRRNQLIAEKAVVPTRRSTGGRTASQKSANAPMR